MLPPLQVEAQAHAVEQAKEHILRHQRDLCLELHGMLCDPAGFSAPLGPYLAQLVELLAPMGDHQRHQLAVNLVLLSALATVAESSTRH